MTRPLRWAFNFATIISAVLFTAVILLWLRSYWVSDEASRLRLQHWALVNSESGGLTIASGFDCGTLYSANLEHEWSYSNTTVTPPRITFGEPKWHFLGLEWSRGTTSANGYMWGLFIPYWILVLLPAATAVAAIRVRGLPGRPGRCRSCGYDLRATPDKCPECGAVPAVPRTNGTG
jgi:hypothetical protein